MTLETLKRRDRGRGRRTASIQWKAFTLFLCAFLFNVVALLVLFQDGYEQSQPQPQPQPQPGFTVNKWREQDLVKTQHQQCANPFPKDPILPTAIFNTLIDQTMDRILARPDSPLVLIACNNEESEISSILMTAQYPWALTLVLPDNAFRWKDIYLYTHILQDLLDSIEFVHTHAWVGTISMEQMLRSDHPLDMVLLNKMLIDSSLIKSTIDVLVFNERPMHSYLIQFQHQKIWTQLLNQTLIYLGDSQLQLLQQQQQQYQGSIMSFGTCFVARPKLIHEYIQWLTRVSAFLQSLSSDFLQQLPGNTTCEEFLSNIQLWVQYILTPMFFTSRAQRILHLHEYLMADRSVLYQSQALVAQEHYQQHLFPLLSRESSSTNPKLFILCHSSETLHRSQRIYANYSFGSYIYFLPSTHFLETFFYTNIIENLLTFVPNSTWVGSISYKAHEKINVTRVETMLMDPTLDPQHHVLVFYNPLQFVPRGTTITLWSQADRVHPGLMSLMEHVLLGVGESREDISMMRQGYPIFKSFYASYFCTNKDTMRDYVSWLHRIMVFMHRDARARKLLWSDSHYDGDVGVAKQVFGQKRGSSYPFHPFLGERLVQYYFNARGYSIVTMEEYVEKGGLL